MEESWDRRGEREAVSMNSLHSKLPITAWTARLVGGRGSEGGE